MVLFLSKEYLDRNITFLSMLLTQFIPDLISLLRNTMVCRTLFSGGLRSSPWWDRGSGLTVSLKAGLDPAFSLRQQYLLQKISCLIPRSNWDCRNLSRSLIETMGTDPGVSQKPQKPIPRYPNFANDYLECLGNSEAICETALSRESGPWGIVWWKNRGSKNSYHCPFKWGMLLTWDQNPINQGCEARLI
jgi:hypothetical protein